MADKQKIENLAETLRLMGGYFVFTAAGEELVLIRKAEFDELNKKTSEVQLGLDVNREAANEHSEDEDIINKANRELAAQYRVEGEELFIEDDGLNDLVELRSPKKVRFESVRGDLPPELQE